MDAMHPHQVDRETDRAQANRDELVERIARATREDGTVEPLKGPHLDEELDATSAAYRVGYHDASHFNREYRRLFGLPPMRDMERLRGTARESISPAAE